MVRLSIPALTATGPGTVVGDFDEYRPTRCARSINASSVVTPAHAVPLAGSPAGYSCSVPIPGSEEGPVLFRCAVVPSFPRAAAHEGAR